MIDRLNPDSPIHNTDDPTEFAIPNIALLGLKMIEDPRLADQVWAQFRDAWDEHVHQFADSLTNVEDGEALRDEVRRNGNLHLVQYFMENFDSLTMAAFLAYLTRRDSDKTELPAL